MEGFVVSVVNLGHCERDARTVTSCSPEPANKLLLATTVGSYLVALLACIAPAAAGEFRLGTAAVKITPPLGTPMAGYYTQRGSRGVLDDLYAKAAVLDDGKTKAALVVCDLIGLPRPRCSKHGG